MSIGINVYALTAFDGEAVQRELHDVSNGESIIDIFRDYIIDNIGEYKDNKNNNNLYTFADWQVVSLKNRQGDLYMTYLYGRMKSGVYGVETDIVDKTTGITTYNKKANEASLLPFDFYVALPADECMQSVIIMQTQGIYGIKSVFSDGLIKYLRSKGIKLGVHFGALYPREYVDRYLRDGKMKKIKLFRYNIPRDEADAFGVNRGNKRVQQVVTVSSPLGFAQSKLDQIRECVLGKRDYNTLIEIENIEFDDLRIEFELGGKKKTISLKNLDRVVVSEDITDRVILNGGNPEKNSIIPVLNETAKEYLIEMGLLQDIEDLYDELIQECSHEARGEDEYEINTGTNG